MRLDRIEDPRSPLDRLRRTELRKYLTFHGIKHDHDSPATTMRALALDAGKLGQDWDPETMNVKLRLVDAEVETTDETPEEEQTHPLSELRIWELRRLCKERKVEWSKTDKADELRAKLNANPA